MKKTFSKTLFIFILSTLTSTLQAKTYSANSFDLDRAKNGNVDAMLRIAKQFDPDNSLFYPVDNQEKDIEIAYEWYEKAAKKNNKEAKEWLYRFYDKHKDKEVALKWFTQQAEKEDALEAFHDNRPANWLGHYYFKQQDYTKAFYWFEEQKGKLDHFSNISKWRYSRRDNLAENYIIEMYRKGIGIKQNYAKALALQEKMVDERKFSVGSLIKYYLITMESKGETADLESLIKQAEKADNFFMRLFGANVESMKLLGAMYMLGDYPENRHLIETNGKVDLDKARYWLEKYFAITDDAEVAYWLSMEGMNGMGNPNMQWLKKAADLGNQYALLKMAAAHYKGNTAIKDSEQAKNYAKLACEKGLSSGCYLYKNIQEYPNYSDLPNKYLFNY